MYLTHNLLLFAAFKCWCQAAWQYSIDFPSHFPLDGDVMWDQYIVFYFILWFNASCFLYFLSEGKKYIYVVQVISKFCFWAFVESLGSFKRLKGLSLTHYYVTLFFVFAFYCFCDSLCFSLYLFSQIHTSI